MHVPEGAKCELVCTDKDGNETRQLIHEFTTSSGIIQGLHNIDKSIGSFARSCFNFALDTKQDIWFASKDTISKKYDHRFKDIFAEIYENEYKEKFEKAGIEYFYTLIDDADSGGDVKIFRNIPNVLRNGQTFSFCIGHIDHMLAKDRDSLVVLLQPEEYLISGQVRGNRC